MLAWHTAPAFVEGSLQGARWLPRGEEAAWARGVDGGETAVVGSRAKEEAEECREREAEVRRYRSGVCGRLTRVMAASPGENERKESERRTPVAVRSRGIRERKREGAVAAAAAAAAATWRRVARGAASKVEEDDAGAAEWVDGWTGGGRGTEGKGH